MNALAFLAVGRRGVQLAGRLQLQLGGDVYAPQRFMAPATPLPSPPPQRGKGHTGLASQGRRGQSGPHPPRGKDQQSRRAYGTGGIKAELREAFGRYHGLVLILPVGAAVRLVAPLLSDKRSDPAVVVLDEAGAHAVALLSGHAGGANQLARDVAAAVGARPVITTAADVLGSLALDLLGKEWGWIIEDDGDLTRASAAVIDGEPIAAYQDAGEEDWWREAPANFVRYASIENLLSAPVAARLAITDRAGGPRLSLGEATDRAAIDEHALPLGEGGGALEEPPLPLGEGGGEGVSSTPTVVYRPKTLVVGIGCVRGATADELDDLIGRTLRDHALALGSVRELATIDVKRAEAGLAALADRYGWPIRYFSAQELGEIGAPSGASHVVERAVGAPGVCEPAALLAAGAASLVVPKTQTRRATMAVARLAAPTAPGSLAVVGLGPGAPEEITERGRRALEAADTIVGYHGYLDLVRPWLGPKTYHGSTIGEEIERCRLAIDLARGGRRVALISSGDAGVYGTAGIVFELLDEAAKTGEAAFVEVVPGVSAAHAAAALLGAPLMSDYAAISLSDLMTPWSVIQRRLEAAAAADLVVVLYNPASAGRQTQLEEARAILLNHRTAQTPVGLVRNASRPGQTVVITDLEHLLEHKVDMLAIVVIGNSATVPVGERLVTRRGYRI